MKSPQGDLEKLINNDRRSNAIRRVKNVSLFFAAPFIALGYVFALPVYGSYKMGQIACEAYKKRRETKEVLKTTYETLEERTTK